MRSKHTKFHAVVGLPFLFPTGFACRAATSKIEFYMPFVFGSGP